MCNTKQQYMAGPPSATKAHVAVQAEDKTAILDELRDINRDLDPTGRAGRPKALKWHEETRLMQRRVELERMLREIESREHHAKQAAHPRNRAALKEIRTGLTALNQKIADLRARADAMDQAVRLSGLRAPKPEYMPVKNCWN